MILNINLLPRTPRLMNQPKKIQPQGYGSVFNLIQRAIPLHFCLWHYRCSWHYWLSHQKILYPNPGGRQNILVMASLCNEKPWKWWRQTLYLKYVLAKWRVLSHWLLISVRVFGTERTLVFSAWLMMVSILASPSGFSKMISWIKFKNLRISFLLLRDSTYDIFLL